MSDRVRRSPLSFLRAAFRVLTAPIRWVRDGESDLDGTYPDRRKPTGEEAATNGSVTTSLTGLGNG